MLQLVSARSGTADGSVSVIAELGATAAAIGAGVALTLRDRRPLLVLGLTTICYAVQVTAGAPVLPAASAVAVERVARVAAASENDVSRARGWASVGVGIVVAAAALGLSGNGFLAAPLGLVLLAAAVIGQSRSTRAIHETARRRELIVAERVRLARDLHDVVGHGMGAITVQAGAARLAVAAGDTTAATRSLLSIETAGRGVLREVRWLVGLLREDSGRRDLADIPELVQAARRSGMDIELEIVGDLTAAGADSGEAAYRIVQEALTNVLRHCGDNAARVTVEVGPTIDIAVHNRLAPGITDAVEGNGLRGVRERVAAVGGHAQLGAGADGWTVRVQLPASGRPR
ncbi:histidine kinase [Jatrophihabitans telluris]|uniref:histidine kinase n=1 Tax=Jatrophihabitans telluris TaxID=2038343 RepID=A0ABY4QVG3_9ACTN|nr:histidine kinase [Jatrophihabitans telluris]UQX86866.1 histidine kinase [Jatrophihabitans telluris]